MQKTRIRKIANFFAFNILFFALYLNFIDRDSSLMPPQDNQQTAAFGSTTTASASLDKTAENTYAAIK